MRYELFTRGDCPNCQPAKEYCEARFEGEAIDCGTDAGLDFARARGVASTPTAIFYDSGGRERARFHSVSELKSAMETGLFWTFLDEGDESRAIRRAKGE